MSTISREIARNGFTSEKHWEMQYSASKAQEKMERKRKQANAQHILLAGKYKQVWELYKE